MSASTITEDIDLVAQLRAGEQRAFEAIYRKYATTLLGFARRNISVREDCEEIIQDVFESLWKRREVTEIAELRPYLFKMVRYKIIHYFKRSLVKRKYEEHFLLFEAVFDQRTEDERSIEPESLQVLIDTTIAKLPDRCQTAFRMRLMENLSNGEIARRMNIKKTTVENYMITAMAHLRSSYRNLSRISTFIIMLILS